MANPQNSRVPLVKEPSTLAIWSLLGLIFLAVQFASLFTPPLLDDVDASHAQVAQHMVESGDWVTMKLNGIRYLEKAPLPYWLNAICYSIFGQNAFATHLPNSLAILGLAWLAWLWVSRGWGRRAGFYAALGVLTAIGPFLFTRFGIPEALLSFLLLYALWSFITGLESRRSSSFYGMWAGPRARHVDQGPDRAGFLRRGSDPSPDAHRTVASLARIETFHRRSALSWPSRLRGTFSADLRTLTRDIPSAIIPRPGTCTASGTSTSSTSTSCASSAADFRTTTTRCLSPGTGWRISSGSSHGACFCLRCSSWHGEPAMPGCSTFVAIPARLWTSTSITPLREDVASYVARLKFRVRSTWLLASIRRLYAAVLSPSRRIRSTTRSPPGRPC